MSLALYRKYRPQTFAELTGQEPVKTTLERQIATEKVAHAYIFSGPRGTGKTSTARILAKAVNCEKRKGDNGNPCNDCENCAAITAGRALDILEIDAATHTQVEHVREVIVETAKFAPTRLRRKVFIIDEAHMLSPSAWNALLKILEEPPAHLLFILATTEVHKVPATILSRCQRFDFRRVSQTDLIKKLSQIAQAEKVKVDAGVLAAVARFSEGGMRDAESLLEQLFGLGEKNITEEVAALVLPRTSIPLALELLKLMAGGDVPGALKQAGGLLEQGIDMPHFIGDLLELLRKVLLISQVGVESVRDQIDAGMLAELEQLAQNLKVAKILLAIEAFSKAKQELKTAAIPELPLEVAVVEVCGKVDGTRSSGVGSAIQGSSSAPLQFKRNGKIAEGAADAPKIASPHRQIVSVEESNDKVYRSVSATLLSRAAAADQAEDGKEVGGAPIPLLEEIKQKWPEVLKAVQETNHSLPFLLSTSAPVAVEKGILQIGVQYPFHCEKLNEQKCRSILETIVGKIYQTPLRVQGVVVYASPPAQTAVSEILNTLGGRVVE